MATDSISKRKKKFGFNGDFTGCKLLIGLFVSISIDETVCKVFKARNITYKIIKNEVQFLEELKNYDEYAQIWIVSNGSNTMASHQVVEFQNLMSQAFNSGIGVLLWAENAPLVVQANHILKKIPIGVDSKNNEIFI